MKTKAISFLFLLFNLVAGQDYFFQRDFGKFEDAVSFKLSPTGFFYLIDNESSEVKKVDSLGEIVKYNGGYGWDESLFDTPVDVCLSGLNILIADLNNHRIQIFDKDLNYLTQLAGTNGTTLSENISFKYPISCTTSSMGDIFVLDSDNKRITKWDPSGKFLLKFGDYESGEYTLQNPTKIDAIFNNVVVLDKDRILLFDIFGNGLLKFTTDYSLTNFNCSYDKIFFNNKNEVFEGEFVHNTLQIRKVNLLNYEFNSEIVQCAGNGDELFVLLKDRIVQFKNKKG